jgi:hypothetical protein
MVPPNERVFNFDHPNPQFPTSLVFMNNPQLVLTTPHEKFRGECSVCAESAFSINEPYDEALYTRVFLAHLEQAHLKPMT